MLRTNGLVLIACAVLASQGCGKAKIMDTMNPSSSSTESAVAVINSLANESEGPSLTQEDVNTKEISCSATTTKSACNVSNQIETYFSSCIDAKGSKLSGGWTTTFSSTNACMNARGSALASGDSMIRRSNGMMMQSSVGGVLRWDTNLHTTYEGTTISDAGLSVSRFGNSRTIMINGEHRTLETDDGKTIYDHSVVSPYPITISGSRLMGDRQITGGSIRIYANDSKSRSETSFSGVMWTSRQCCYPTTGTMTTSMSGSKSGVVTLSFSQTCGVAQLIDLDGTRTTVTLQQCE